MFHDRPNMSGVMLASRAAQRSSLQPFFQKASFRSLHLPISRVGGPLKHPVGQRHSQERIWPSGAYSIHNVPAVRSISFARALPKLVLKFARIPAMFGAAGVAGLAYLQYQATRKCDLWWSGWKRLMWYFCRGGHIRDGRFAKSERFRK